MQRAHTHTQVLQSPKSGVRLHNLRPTRVYNLFRCIFLVVVHPAGLPNFLVRRKHAARLNQKCSKLYAKYGRLRPQRSISHFISVW